MAIIIAHNGCFLRLVGWRLAHIVAEDAGFRPHPRPLARAWARGDDSAPSPDPFPIATGKGSDPIPTRLQPLSAAVERGWGEALNTQPRHPPTPFQSQWGRGATLYHLYEVIVLSIRCRTSWSLFSTSSLVKRMIRKPNSLRIAVRSASCSVCFK